METNKTESSIKFNGSVRKNYWENIYDQKKLTEVGWYQARPELSLELIHASGLSKKSKIIDIGGGDSLLVDYLLELGYSDLSVLDVSDKAIEKAKLRLGDKAKRVTWICSDITEFKPEEVYDLWHDRACFHFLTQKEEVESYTQIVTGCLKPKGMLVLGTFSKTGPLKCSGLEIQQYDEHDLKEVFKFSFEAVSCVESAHVTPSSSTQNYVFCSFKRM